jgi:hypothetical protein
VLVLAFFLWPSLALTVFGVPLAGVMSALAGLFGLLGPVG